MPAWSPLAHGQGNAQPMGVSGGTSLQGYGSITYGPEGSTTSPAAPPIMGTFRLPQLRRLQTYQTPSSTPNRNSIDVQPSERPEKPQDGGTVQASQRGEVSEEDRTLGRTLGRHREDPLADPPRRYEFAMVLTGKAATCHKERAIAVYLRRKGVLVDICKYNGMVLLRLSAPELILEHMGELTCTRVRLQEEYGGGWLAYQKELRHLYVRTPRVAPPPRDNLFQRQPDPSSTRNDHQPSPLSDGGQTRELDALYSPDARGIRKQADVRGGTTNVQGGSVQADMMWETRGGMVASGSSGDSWSHAAAPRGGSLWPQGLTPPGSGSSGTSTWSSFDDSDSSDRSCHRPQRAGNLQPLLPSQPSMLSTLQGFAGGGGGGTERGWSSSGELHATSNSNAGMPQTILATNNNNNNNSSSHASVADPAVGHMPGSDAYVMSPDTRAATTAAGGYHGGIGGAGWAAARVPDGDPGMATAAGWGGATDGGTDVAKGNASVWNEGGQSSWSVAGHAPSVAGQATSVALANGGMGGPGGYHGYGTPGTDGGNRFTNSWDGGSAGLYGSCGPGNQIGGGGDHGGYGGVSGVYGSAYGGGDDSGYVGGDGGGDGSGYGGGIGGGIDDGGGSGIGGADVSQGSALPTSPLGEACFPSIPPVVPAPEILPMLPRILTGRAPHRPERHASRLSQCSEDVAEGRWGDGNSGEFVEERGVNNGGAGDRGFGAVEGARVGQFGIEVGGEGEGLARRGDPNYTLPYLDASHHSGPYNNRSVDSNWRDHRGQGKSHDSEDKQDNHDDGIDKYANSKRANGKHHGHRDGDVTHQEEDGSSVFSAAERQRLLYTRIIHRAHGANLNILRLMKNGIVASDGFFALHDSDWRQRILGKVRRDRRFPFSDHLGVVDDIQFYCGEKTAFYFAFQAFFIRALVAPVLFGSIIYLLELMEVFDVSTLQPVYAILVSLWSTVAIELWERKMMSLRHHWGTQGFHHQEHPRPQFGWSKSCLDFNETKTRKNAVTGEDEEYYPLWKFAVKQLLSAVFLGSLIGSLIFLLYWIFAIRFPVDTSHPVGLDKRTLLEYLPVLIVYGLCMPLLNVVYDKIAHRTNEWENWRTAAGFENRLIVKCFSFILVNNFLAVFVVAFQHVSIKEAGVTPPSLVPQIRSALFAQVMVFMILQSLISEKGKVLVRQIYHSLLVWLKRTEQEPLDEEEYATSSTRKRAKDAKASVQNAWSETFKPDFDFRYEYGDLMSVIGFVMLFAILFPLSPLIAVVNIYIKIRVDIHNLMWGCRRPMPERAKSIGAWLIVLRLMATFSVLTNITLDTVLNENLTHRSPQRKFVYAVVVEHGLFALQYIIRSVMKRSPARLAKERQRQQRQIELLVEEHKLSQRAADKVLGRRNSLDVMSPTSGAVNSPFFSPVAGRRVSTDADPLDTGVNSIGGARVPGLPSLGQPSTATPKEPLLLSPRRTSVETGRNNLDFSPYVCSPTAPAPMESLRVPGRRPVVPVLSKSTSMLWRRGTREAREDGLRGDD
eukprot:jgi/Mesvir1/27169/Mv20830-RA.1